MGMSYRAIAEQLSINGETPVSFVQIFKDVRRAKPGNAISHQRNL
jgi:hypothetical protein